MDIRCPLAGPSSHPRAGSGQQGLLRARPRSSLSPSVVELAREYRATWGTSDRSGARLAEWLGRFGADRRRVARQLVDARVRLDPPLLGLLLDLGLSDDEGR